MMESVPHFSHGPVSGMDSSKSDEKSVRHSGEQVPLTVFDFL